MTTLAYRKQPVRQIPDDYRDPAALPIIRNFAIEADRALQTLIASSQATGTITVGSLPDAGNYFYLPGRSGGQTAYGGADASDTLRLRSTAHATKGKIIFGAAGISVYDEVNERFGIATANPSVPLHVVGMGKFTDTLTVDQQGAPDAIAVHYRSGIMSGSPLILVDDDLGSPTVKVDTSGNITAGALILQVGLGGFTVTFVPAALTAPRTITLPNLTGTVQLLSGAQTSSAQMTWTGLHTFTNAAAGVVVNSGVTRLYATGGFTIATGAAKVLTKRMQLTGAQRASLSGTARVRIT